MIQKKSVGKKFSYGGKCIWTEDVYNHRKKRGWILKTSFLYSKYRWIEEKSFLWKRPDFKSCNFISWDFIGSPHIILEKSPRNLKLRTLFPVTFCQKIGNFLPKVFFPGFFPYTFFPVTFSPIFNLRGLNCLNPLFLFPPSW